MNAPAPNRHDFRPRKGASRWWLWCPLVLSTAVYVWTAPTSRHDATSRTANDYYAWLSDAFLSGQLYLKIEPDPRLKTLANPSQELPGDNIPRLPEASYYQGHYYLYFSALPALLVFIPWRLLFGTFISDSVGILLFSWAGLILAASTLWWLWRRWFSDLSGVWFALGLLMMALGTTVVFLVQSPMTHGVPISCAFCCAMATIGALVWTLTRTRLRMRALGLGLTSLGWGLAVASRPNYIFSLPALIVPMLYLAIITVRGNHGNWRQIGYVILAGLLPAAVVGAGMAAYNYARFGNILDFGVYEYVGAIQLTRAPFSLSNLGSNLRTFILAPPAPPYLSAYYPFFPAWRPYWGVLYSTPFILLVFVTPLTLLARRWREDAVWVVLGLTLLAAVGLNLLSILTMTMLVGVTERYLVDFLPLVVFLGVLTMWALLSWAPPALRPGRSRIVRAGILVLVFASLSYSTLALFIRHDFAHRSHAVARFADSLVHTVEQWRGVRHGALTLRVRFPAGNTGGREPLLVTAQGRDVLYVEYPALHEIRVGFFHTGAGGPVSDPITVTPGQEYELFVDLGSLYPPKDHPLLAALTESQADALLRRVFVTLDGQTVLNAHSTFYPTSPGDLLLGEDPYPIMAPGRFSGRLRTLARHGIPSPGSLHGPAGDGPVRLTVIFPPFRAYHSEPLVSTGHRDAGDLLYVTYVAPGKIRFGHDDSGGGSVETPVVNYTPGQAHVLEVDLGSLHAPPAHDPFEGSLIVNFDGRLLMNYRRQFHATAPIDVVFGFNGMDSSVSEMMFAGKIVAVDRPGALMPGSDNLAAGLGAVRLSLRFPQFRTGHHEPLLVTGRPGAADLIYVSYDSENAVRLGYDHWGVGGPVSAPIPIDYRATHLIEISMGSLYPPLGSPAWGDAPDAVRRQVLGSVKVTLDGKPVMSHPCTAYPATPSEIAIGNNMAGASTAEYQFTGSILWHEILSPQNLTGQQ